MQQAACFKAWVLLNISYFTLCFCSADVMKRAPPAWSPRNLGSNILTSSSFVALSIFNS